MIGQGPARLSRGAALLAPKPRLASPERASCQNGRGAIMGESPERASCQSGRETHDGRACLPLTLVPRVRELFRGGLAGAVGLEERLPYLGGGEAGEAQRLQPRLELHRRDEARAVLVEVGEGGAQRRARDRADRGGAWPRPHAARSSTRRER